MKISTKWKRVMKRRLKLLVLVVVAYFSVSWWREWKREKILVEIEQYKSELRNEGFGVESADIKIELSPEESVLMDAFYAAADAHRSKQLRLDDLKDGVIRVSTNACISAVFEGSNSKETWEKIRENWEDIDRAIEIVDSLAVVVERADPVSGDDYCIGTIKGALMQRIPVALDFGENDLVWNDLAALAELVSRNKVSGFHLFDRGPKGYDKVRWLVWQALRSDNPPTYRQMEEVRSALEENDSLGDLSEVFAQARMGSVESLEYSIKVFEGVSFWQIIRQEMKGSIGFNSLGSTSRKFIRTAYEYYYGAGPSLPNDFLALMRFYTEEEQRVRDLPPDPTLRAMRGRSALMRNEYPPGLNPYWGGHVYLRMYQGFLENVVTGECIRRLTINALSVEMHRLKSGSLPVSLEEVEGTMPDFATGELHHYIVHPDGEFVIYSVGADGADDGGTLALNLSEFYGIGELPPWDIVWPKLATEEEIEQWRASDRERRRRFDAIYGKGKSDSEEMQEEEGRIEKAI